MSAQRATGGDHGHMSVVTEAGAGAVGAPDMPSVYARRARRALNNSPVTPNT